MKDLLEAIVRSLVDHPSEVSVNEVHGEKSTILELKVYEDDVGKVIGKQGRMAEAIRTLLRVKAAKTGTRATLEIL